MNFRELVKTVILSNRQPPEKRRVGVEIECIIYDRHLNRLPVNPGSAYSASDLLEDLKIIDQPFCKNISYSLEPGGQLEFASSPFCSLNEVAEQYQRHYKSLIELGDKHHLSLIDYALEPVYSPDQVELINLSKYRFMHDVFATSGHHGHWMMRNTASVQVNIDFSSPEEAEEMAFLADCLQPVAAVLFSHAPFFKGKPAGRDNLRYRVWNDTDPSRCGDLLEHGITSPFGLLDKYIDWVLSTPIIFAIDEDGSPMKFNGTASDWFKILSEKGQLNERAVQTVLHQIFTHVRFKNVLEVRGSDRPLCGHELAPAAFWLGLLTVNKVRMRVLEYISGWTTEDRRRLIKSASVLDLNQPVINGKKLGDLVFDVCAMALCGLDERAELLETSERPRLEAYMKIFEKNGPPTLFVQNQYLDGGLPLNKFIKTCAMTYE